MEKFLAVLLFAVVAGWTQTKEVDTNATTPIVKGRIVYDTIKDKAVPTDKSVQIENLKKGDRLVVNIQRMKASAAHKLSAYYAINDYCVGSDSKNYKCIANHTSVAARKPITGISWTTYWVQNTSLILDSTAYVLKDTTVLNDFDVKINIDYFGKKHNYDSIP